MKNWLILVAIALCGSSGVLVADVLNMNGVRTVVQTADTPRRGMTKAQVLERYGEPVSRRAAVGDPPISRWDYNGYSVYFEYDLVLHSLIRR